MRLYDYDSLRPVSSSMLKKLTGVTVIPKTNLKEVITLFTCGEYDSFKQIKIDLDTSNDLLDMYSREHSHTFEQSLYVIEGGAIFDIRSSEGLWTRIELERNDFMFMPDEVRYRFISPAKNLKALCLTPSGANACMELVKENSPTSLPLIAQRELQAA